jgi:hypothetical protein
VGHAELGVLTGRDDQRVQRGLVVAGTRVADDDLDVVRALGDPVGDERSGLAGAGQQAALAGAGDAGRLPGAMAGVPALRMSVSPAAPRSGLITSGRLAISSAVVTPNPLSSTS